MSEPKESAERGPLRLTVNDDIRTITVEPRMTLLEQVREGLGLTGPKKACDRGECGACTVPSRVTTHEPPPGLNP